jgi:hypothetical protein
MSDSIIKRSLGWLVCILLGLFALCFLLPFILTGYPPNWMERHNQRQQILQRVQSAGGWEALKRDCDSLTEKYKDSPYGFRWFPELDTNPLPPAIAVLKPKEIVFYPPQVLNQFGAESNRWFGSNLLVSISIFGAHATGGHDQPWLGLAVLCGPTVVNCKLISLRSTTPLRYWRYRKVTDNIYEYY